jgi:thiol:disulfide interchange protein/DsbC/DsbD-like thiol-disulfide interchange protein
MADVFVMTRFTFIRLARNLDDRGLLSVPEEKGEQTDLLLRSEKTESRGGFSYPLLWPVLLLLLLVVPVTNSYAASGPSASTPHVEAQLVAEKSAIAPGETLWAALRLKMIDGWHTYWKHPGDSGEPTTITWELPDGFTAGEIHWPYPEAISMDPLTTYGYHGEVFLLVPLTAPQSASAGQTAHFKAGVYWMVCEEVCIPEEVTLTLSLPVVNEPAGSGSAWSTTFERTRSMLPVADAGWRGQAVRRDDRFILRLDSPAGVTPDADSLRFFAAEGPWLEYAAPQQVTVRDGSITLELVASPYMDEAPDRLRGIILSSAAPLSAAGASAIELDIPLNASPLMAGALATSGSNVPTTLWFALTLAFLGGMILNLMPCVFPVVSLKVLSFVRSSGDDPRRIRLHGLSFAGGVIVAFWALAGLLLLLRAAGDEIGWGFQLQSPLFVAVMAFLLFGLGLSLAGVLDIGTSLTRLGNAERSTGTLGGSAMNGALATVVATPCTAPFMGAALGFAMTQPAVASLAIFTSLGAGMAAPYVALSAWPVLLRFLPRPGAWMNRFKQLMAFPLFATVAWLVWVFGIQTGIDGVLRLLLGLTLLALAGWIIGQWSTLSARARSRWLARGGAAALTIAAIVLAMAAEPVTAQVQAAQTAGGKEGIAWEVYSAERLAGHRAAGRPVFIDFTAAWCLSCKVNERVAFSSAEVHSLVRDRGVVMLKADWTSRDPEITRALAEFGRSGVPLYVLYGTDPFEPPRLLPEILSPGILMSALREIR